MKKMMGDEEQDTVLVGWVGDDTDVYTLGYGCMEKGKERKIWEEMR